jgi:hypothetical protein
MSEELFPVIAKAKKAWLGVEDHGILSVNVDFDYGGSMQGTGHYSLDTHIKHTSLGSKYPVQDKRVGTQWGMEFIRRLLLAMGVDWWSDIPGRTVYVLRDEDGFGGMIRGIRPLPTEPGVEFIFDDLKVLLEEGDR